MNIPTIPNNSLSEEIKEIVELCEKQAPRYGREASWFDPPATEEEITECEEKNNIKIPESYKDWLRFSDDTQILHDLAHFYGVKMIGYFDQYVPEDYVVIGDLIGDGEYLCISKTTGKIIRLYRGKVDEVIEFKDILKNTIRMLKGESGLSKKSKDMLFAMAKESKKYKEK